MGTNATEIDWQQIQSNFNCVLIWKTELYTEAQYESQQRTASAETPMMLIYCIILRVKRLDKKKLQTFCSVNTMAIRSDEWTYNILYVWAKISKADYKASAFKIKNPWDNIWLNM